ncbi:hypothetical protein C0995_011895 [Termitomyces sp. Mi166|nr:hypothetical protein C0995_011895 [Termitomyces sp. Mi166\
MATTPASAARRLKQHVYVNVPPSPYPIALSSSQKPSTMPRLTSLALKENTPFRPFNGDPPRSVTDTPALKRKASEIELLLAKAANVKKQKLAEEPAADATQHRASAAANACPEFPNASVHCTSAKTVKGIEKLCSVKICDLCLKKRYGEDPDKIKAVGKNGVYTFKKPSASNSEQPLNVSGPSKPTKKSTVEVLITTTPSKGLYSEIPGSVVEATMSKTTKPEPAAVKRSTETKAEAKSKQQTLRQMLPQSLPKLKWTEVPTILDLNDAKSRLQIREFILRFASVMEPSIPRAQLVELDDIGCGSDDDEMAPWVSDACVRSMLLGLLGMLATLEGEIRKHIKSSICDIRATGNNLNKIWPILARLQDVIDDKTRLSIPDPLPLPASVVVYNTRTTRRAPESSSGANIAIGHTAQMIPVLEALIEAALETPIIHEELDNGFKEAKEVIREVQKAIKEENERWDAERKSLESPKETSEEMIKPMNMIQQIKIKRGLHKMRIRDLENALRLVTPGFAPRFIPMGTDRAGRVYWASSPGVVERKVALDFITSATVSKKGRTRVVDDGAPTKWSWFVAVWGRKTSVARNDVQVVEDDDDERWWAFTDPVEIRKVADWIRIDAGIDPNGEADANKPLASLVKRLNEYAQLLDWRLKEDKYASAVA